MFVFSFSLSLTLWTDQSYSWLSLSWWEKLTLLTRGRGGLELDSSQRPFPPPEPGHQTPFYRQDIWFTVCMTKKGFLVRVFYNKRTRPRGRNFFSYKRRSIVLEFHTNCFWGVATAKVPMHTTAPIIHYRRSAATSLGHCVSLCQLSLALCLCLGCWNVPSSD